MAPILGSASRVGEVSSGKKGLSMTMAQRLRARFGVPADVLLPPVGKAKVRRAGKRKAASLVGCGPDERSDIRGKRLNHPGFRCAHPGYACL